jgi:uncharacterized LabA/DUF88 family protein
MQDAPFVREFIGIPIMKKERQKKVRFVVYQFQWTSFYPELSSALLANFTF